MAVQFHCQKQNQPSNEEDAADHGDRDDHDGGGEGFVRFRQRRRRGDSHVRARVAGGLELGDGRLVPVDPSECAFFFPAENFFIPLQFNPVPVVRTMICLTKLYKRDALTNAHF